MTFCETHLDLKKIRSIYENELLNSVIPFWEANAIDTTVGGFHTFLDEDGSRYDDMKYMWMQWRIVYMFATLYESPYKKDSWLDIAQTGFDYLSIHGKDTNEGSTQGHYYFALNGAGQPAVAPYNVYSECFASMAAAALYKTTGDKVHRTEAERSYTHFRSRISNPKGPWEKNLSGSKEYKSLGHYMMLANMGQVMLDCLGDDSYVTQIEESITEVLESFLNPESLLIYENVNIDNSIDLNSIAGRTLNPGHGLESLWFIMQYAESKNRLDWIDTCAKSVLSILEFSWDKEYGGIYYFMDVLGKPPMELQWDMKLWWVHNEALIAILYAYHLTGQKEFLDWFKKVNDWTWKHFPDCKHGEWYAYLNRQGQATHKLKGGKWKTLFHLPRFLLVGGDLLDKIIDKEQGPT